MTRSKPGRMIQKNPRHAKFFGQFRRQRFDPEGFRGVMASVKDVQAQFLRQRIRPVRPFARDERVHPFRGGDLQLAPRPARHHPDAPASRGAARQKNRRPAQYAGELFRQDAARDAGAGLPAQGPPAFHEEGKDVFKAQRGAKQGVVAQSAMRVQRQMRTVNSQVVFDEQFEQRVARAGPGNRRPPKQSVMHDQQPGLGGRGQLHGGQGGVHRGGDFGHRAGIFHLQPVGRALIIVERVGAQPLLAMGDEGAKRWRAHGRM